MQRPNPGARRFEGTRDDKALATVRAQRCLIAGKIAKVTRWKGVHPHKVQVTDEYQHTCSRWNEAHHPQTKARGGHDRDTVCLCSAAHQELHYLGPKKFAALWGIDVSAVERR